MDWHNAHERVSSTFLNFEFRGHPKTMWTIFWTYLCTNKCSCVQCVQEKSMIRFDFLFFSFFTDRICGDICTQFCTCGSSRLPKDKFCCSNTSCRKNENEDGEVNCPTKGTLNPVYRDINTLQITEL